MKRQIVGKLAAALFKVALAMMKLSGKLAGRVVADDARGHIRTTVAIAAWPPGTADALIGHGATPTATARAFADALRAERVQ